jgi:hypothetical protein
LTNGSDFIGLGTVRSPFIDTHLSRGRPRHRLLVQAWAIFLYESAVSIRREIAKREGRS